MRTFEISCVGIFCVVVVTLGLGIAVTYLDLGSRTTDVRKTIRIVEETQPLGDRLEKFLPSEHRHCEARVLDRRSIRVEVACLDTAKAGHVLKWEVSLKNGTVHPSNPAAERLDKGNEPWPAKT